MLGGVPQGSILGPPMFNLHTPPLDRIMNIHDLTSGTLMIFSFTPVCHSLTTTHFLQFAIVKSIDQGAPMS